MFIALKDNKIIAYNKTGEFPCLVCDEIKETENMDLLNVGEEFLPKTDERAVAKIKEDIRAVRNFYLRETDKYMIVDYPLTEAERQSIKAYRKYLRDYTLAENWWQTEPLGFGEWSNVVTNNKLNG